MEGGAGLAPAWDCVRPGRSWNALGSRTEHRLNQKEPGPGWAEPNAALTSCAVEVAGWRFPRAKVDVGLTTPCAPRLLDRKGIGTMGKAWTTPPTGVATRRCRPHHGQPPRQRDSPGGRFSASPPARIAMSLTHRPRGPLRIGAEHRPIQSGGGPCHARSPVSSLQPEHRPFIRIGFTRPMLLGDWRGFAGHAATADPPQFEKGRCSLGTRGRSPQRRQPRQTGIEFKPTGRGGGGVGRAPCGERHEEPGGTSRALREPHFSDAGGAF